MALANVVRLSPVALVRRDLLAGVVVGVIALPLSIALAVAVGVSPVAGLYTAAFAPTERHSDSSGAILAISFEKAPSARTMAS